MRGCLVRLAAGPDVELPPDDRVRALLGAAGYGGRYELHPLRGGTNNRVYRVDAGDGRALLKVYFSDGRDTRDRLGVEQAFLRFAAARGIASVPRVLGADAAAGLGLYEFIDGRPYSPGEVGAADVEGALDLALALNGDRAAAEAAGLPAASDSCFSGADYLRSVDRRLERLSEMQPADAVEHEAARFVRDELAPAWADAKRSFAERAREARWSIDEALPLAARCMSPSDFGFHNALATAAGPRFIDFEYAGWDDPAKLVCDFFGQFEVPVPMSHFERFAATFAERFDDRVAVRARMAVVFPACRFKWCCIILNDFHPAVRERRSFSHAGAAYDERPRRQLQKARAALQALVAAAPSY
jgi:hypothetical protein